MRVPQTIVKRIDSPYKEDGSQVLKNHTHMVRAEIYQVLPNGACLYKLTEILSETGAPTTFTPRARSIGDEGGFNVKMLDLFVANGVIKVESWQGLEPKPLEVVKPKRSKKTK